MVALRAEGLELEIVEDSIQTLGIAHALTPDERAFLESQEASDHERLQFVWRYEAFHTLLWALGYVESLSFPETICDFKADIVLLRDSGRDRFIEDARLRSESEMLDEADLTFRYHWAVRDAQISGRDVPSGIEPGVVMERHHTLNWLIRLEDAPWDEVSTGT